MSTEIISTQEATTYLQNRGITDIAIIGEMIRGSQNRRIYIALQADNYHCIARNRKPSALDFRAEFEPLIERCIRHLEIVERDMLRIIASVPIWDKEMIQEVLQKFYPAFSEASFTYIMGLSCIITGDNNTYQLFSEIRDFLAKEDMNFPQTVLSDFLFDLYDKKLQNLTFENLTPFQCQLFQFAFDAGAKTSDVQTFCLWFEHKSEVFEQAKQYPLLLSLHEQLSTLLSPQKKEFYNEYIHSLYKRIYYNTLLNKQVEARKILQALSPAQVEKYKELYAISENLIEKEEPQASSEEQRQKWEKKLQKGVDSDIEKGNLHFKLAKDYLDEDDYDNAYHHIKEAHKARRNILGDYHKDTVDCLILMGEYYQKKENTLEAIKHYQRALDISLKNDRHDGLIARLLFEIADMSIKRKDFQKSVDYFKRCLREWELLGVELNEMIANSHFKIGYVYDEVRNWDPALQQYAIALEMRRNLFGENHDKVADVLHNIGTVYYNRNIFQEAIRYLERAIKVRVNASNTVRRSLALSYYNLALAFIKLGRKSEAEKVLEKAVAIFDHINDNEMKMKSKNMLTNL